MATLIAEKSLASTKTAIPIATKASHVPRPIGCALPSTAATLYAPNAAIPTRFRRCIARVGMIQSGRAVCRDGAFCDRRVPGAGSLRERRRAAPPGSGHVVDPDRLLCLARAGG